MARLPPVTLTPNAAAPNWRCWPPLMVTLPESRGAPFSDGLEIVTRVLATLKLAEPVTSSNASRLIMSAPTLISSPCSERPAACRPSWRQSSGVAAPDASLI